MTPSSGRLCQSINRPPSTRRHLYLRQILGWPRALKGQMAGHICSRLRQKSCLGPYTRYSWCRWQRMSHRGAGELGDGGWGMGFEILDLWSLTGVLPVQFGAARSELPASPSNPSSGRLEREFRPVALCSYAFPAPPTPRYIRRRYSVSNKPHFSCASLRPSRQNGRGRLLGVKVQAQGRR